MEVKLFKKIGLMYAVLCFLGSSYGAVNFFKRLVNNEYFCNGFFCEDDTIHAINLTIGVIVCMMSAMFSVLVKIGIDEEKPEYVRCHRMFMLFRNLILMVRWTFLSVALKLAQFDGDTSPGVEREQNTATALLVTISIVCGLEIWIIEGIQRYIEDRLYGEEHTILV